MVPTTVMFEDKDHNKYTNRAIQVTASFSLKSIKREFASNKQHTKFQRFILYNTKHYFQTKCSDLVSLLLFLAFFARFWHNIRIFCCILQSLGSYSNQSLISTSLCKQHWNIRRQSTHILYMQ